MTRPTTTYSRGDIVLVPFAFSEGTGFKSRPALVISSDFFHSGRADLIIAAVTGRIREPLLPGDYLLRGWREAGLLKPSIVTGILRTMKHQMVRRRLGRMPGDELEEFARLMRQALAL